MDADAIVRQAVGTAHRCREGRMRVRTAEGRRALELGRPGPASRGARAKGGESREEQGGGDSSRHLEEMYSGVSTRAYSTCAVLSGARPFRWPQQISPLR